MNDLETELARMRSIPETWTYRVIRCWRDRKGNHTETVESGILGCSVARAKAEVLQAVYDKENPDKDSWTKDLFGIELERQPS